VIDFFYILHLGDVIESPRHEMCKKNLGFNLWLGMFIMWKY